MLLLEGWLPHVWPFLMLIFSRFVFLESMSWFCLIFLLYPAGVRIWAIALKSIINHSLCTLEHRFVFVFCQIIVCLVLGTLEVRLMGCQDILENVPGRSKATSITLPGWSPNEARSSFMSRTSKSKSGSSRNLLKTDDLSSSVYSYFSYFYAYLLFTL